MPIYEYINLHASPKDGSQDQYDARNLTNRQTRPLRHFDTTRANERSPPHAGATDEDTDALSLARATVAITTVGYGDYYAVTILGRFVAIALMIGGIALIGVVTATLASWIVERVSIETKTAAAATEEQVDALHAEVAELKEMIRVLTPSR
ncbi:ABC-type multidrug transport system fused ATPase/permease subunit [Microbacterium sp. AK009]|uniref:potassium channel family protein n=1 Tax=Microbacterium sp. AK009 TaxID=2723068 RepID=UPI0015C6A27C|nr:potassium channel family protein [Microbacterium sp. AK009]NYF16147.1 ABC-type multidrug transport system fused ATPase/permease subunit [Microbacterium sp. AK009]